MNDKTNTKKKRATRKSKKKKKQQEQLQILEFPFISSYLYYQPPSLSSYYYAKETAEYIIQINIVV